MVLPSCVRAWRGFRPTKMKLDRFGWALPRSEGYLGRTSLRADRSLVDASVRGVDSFLEHQQQTDLLDTGVLTWTAC